jgi:hypothetical protein
MTITSAHTLDHPAQRERTWLRLAGRAGIAGPILFTVVFLAQDLLRSGYDPIAEPISALEAGRHGWIQQLNFVVFGVLTLVFATGLHRGLERTKAGLIGPALFAVSGIGLLVAAAIPLREDAAGVVYDPGGHIVGGVLFFPVTAVALIVLSRRLARDPRWRSLAGHVLAAGVVGAAVVLVTITLVLPDGGPLHHLAGLVQRLAILAIFFPARLVLSARLLRIAT